MNREVHVRFCEGVGVKFPRATRPLIHTFAFQRCPQHLWLWVYSFFKQHVAVMLIERGGQQAESVRSLPKRHLPLRSRVRA